MSPFWHPLSVLLLPELRSYASPTMVRMLLAANGKVELRYAGDAMWPAVGHGELVTAEPLSPNPIVLGQAVIACPAGIPDLLRVVGRTPQGQLQLQGDSNPDERGSLRTRGTAGLAGRRAVHPGGLQFPFATRRSCGVASPNRGVARAGRRTPRLRTPDRTDPGVFDLDAAMDPGKGSTTLG